jgi:signal transduction histidine kinase
LGNSGFAFIFFVAGLFSSYVVYVKYYENGIESLQSRAQTIADALDEDKIKALNGNESDPDNPSYIEIKSKLAKIKIANPDTRFIYIMGERGGELFFFVDSEDPDSEGYSPPGEIYPDESPATTLALREGLSGTEGPIVDNFGTWITGVAPIVDKDGKVLASLGIDIEANEYFRNAILRALLAFLLSFVIVIVLLFEYRVRKKEQGIVELRSQFLAVATHEIRSPLSGIAWALDSLSSVKEIPEQTHILLDDIKSKTNNLVETINDILDAFSLDFKKKDLVKKNINLRDLIQTVFASLEYLKESKKINLKMVNSIPSDSVVVGDQKNISQVFSNLLSNAIKYSKESGEIEISYQKISNFHEVSITDHGVGIPKDEISKIFNGFYRASNVRDLKIQGSGLGLFLVKRIVGIHGGDIFLDSKLGEGTKVTVRLPVSLEKL